MKKYSSAYASKNYDAIVIGSGLGGLTTAAILAKEGKKVLVLERHYTPGGFTHTFRRKKFEWDVGLHYVGDINSNELLKNIFDYVTAFPIIWEPMGDNYDTIIIEGDKYEFVAGENNLINQLINYFPGEEKAIKEYFRLVKKVNDSSPFYFSERLFPPKLGYFFSKLMRKRFLIYAEQTTYEVLSNLTENEKLISVLCGQCGNYGLTPKLSSFAIHALVAGHYLEGGCFPIGGASVIFDAINAVIEKSDGVVLIKAEVDSILIEENIAIGVKMTNGDIIKASKIISNAGVKNTYNNLIKEKDSISYEIRSELNGIKPSVSHVALYIGLNASDEELNLPKGNYWIYNNYNLDEGYKKYLNNPEGEPPLAYISFPSAKDPNWEIKHPGTSTIQVLGLGSYEHAKKWEDKTWMKRGEDYSKYKEELTSKLLEKLYTIVPQIKGHIEICELSTPISTKHFSNYQTGEIYGLEHTPARFKSKILRPKTPVKNLFLTGQDIVSVGIASALFSGLLTGTSILKKNLFFKIKKAKH